MIEISYTAGLVTVTIGWILFRAAMYRKTKHFDFKYELRQIFFLINLLVIARFVFYPFSKVDGQVQPLLFEPDKIFPLRVNLVPLVNILQFDTVRDLILNLTGNFAMFIPTGIMTPLIYKHLNSFKQTVLTGFLISLTIEIIQLPFAVRCSDVDDLILNTLGCVIGYGFLSLVRALRRK